MCVPCSKEVINDAAVLYARLAGTIRKMSLLTPVEISDEQDDFLFQMAEREVKAIQGVKESAVRLAKMQGSPERWVKLMEKL